MQHLSLMDTPAVAGALGLQVNTRQIWRVHGKGPRFIRCGRLIRYRPEDVSDWIASNSAQSTSEAA